MNVIATDDRPCGQSGRQPMGPGRTDIGDPVEVARSFHAGDVVRNFKRETLVGGEARSQRYLYRILAFARHTETEEDLVVYEALYPPFGVWARPLSMFMGEVDRAKYPGIQAHWRFEHATEADLRDLTR